MNKYRRKIVGVAKRVDETFVLTYAAPSKFSEKVRYRSEFVIRYGFRLECGHAVDAEQGKGKKAVTCYECECLADREREPVAPHPGLYLEFDTIYSRGEWEDASENETKRIQAQS